MEAARLIERRGNLDDRRSIKIHLTPQGSKNGTGSREAHQKRTNREFLEAFTEAEKRLLIDLIKKMRTQPVR